MSDTTQAVAAGLAGLAIALQVLLAVLLVMWLLGRVWAPPRRALGALTESLAGGELLLAGIVAVVATAGSLYFSEIADFVPCRLCWFQRIAMYPLAVMLPFAAIRRDFRNAPLYALPMALAGAGVAIYHIYIENNPDAESAGCKISAPCSTKWIDEFGYVTIPTLALTAFVVVFWLCLTGWRRARV